jgi:hypothetical protein
MKCMEEAVKYGSHLKKGQTMKSLSFLKRFGKFKVSNRRDMEWKRNTIKKGEKYEIRVDPNIHYNENDPFLIRKEKEATESLTKHPLPDWVLNRTLEEKQTP